MVRRRLRVPEVTAFFWVAKAISTALGEVTSDYSVHVIEPVVAVLLGLAAFVIALALQLAVRRYIAWTYWLAVVMVGTFGTMAADALHVALGVPYIVTTILYAVALAIVFVAWWASERTLSFHDINTTRRELFYWSAVIATFAMGTALGDLTAITLHFAYLPSIALFGAIILATAAAFRLLHWNAVFCFWFAYVMTRPFGASIADGVAKPAAAGGRGFGDATVALVLALLMLAVVTFLALSPGSQRRRKGMT